MPREGSVSRTRVVIGHVELPGVAPVEIPALRGSDRQISWAEKIRAEHVRLIVQTWTAADAHGERPPTRHAASWRTFAVRHLYAVAATAHAYWLIGQSRQRVEPPVFGEISAQAAALDLGEIKRIARQKVDNVMQADRAGDWIAAETSGDLACDRVWLRGDHDPIPRDVLRAVGLWV